MGGRFFVDHQELDPAQDLPLSSFLVGSCGLHCGRGANSAAEASNKYQPALER
jgi:hypothetical protein